MVGLVSRLSASGLGVLALRELVLRRNPPRLLQLSALTQAIRSAGHDMAEDVRGMHVPLRAQRHVVKGFLDSPGPFPKRSPAFMVVCGPQGTGKSTMLQNLLAEYHDEGRWVLPILWTLKPGEKLQLESVVKDVVQIDKLPDTLPQLKLPLMRLMRQLKGKRIERNGGPLIIYMQLSTQNDFNQKQCDALAAAIGGFARDLTYEFTLCKFVLEVSASPIADKIQEGLPQNFGVNPGRKEEHSERGVFGGKGLVASPRRSSTCPSWLCWTHCPSRALWQCSVLLRSPCELEITARTPLPMAHSLFPRLRGGGASDSGHC